MGPVSLKTFLMSLDYVVGGGRGRDITSSSDALERFSVGDGGFE